MKQGSGATELDWADAYGNIDWLAGLVPTGGTTGPAKGVCVTNLAWGTMTEMATHYWRGGDRDPVCLCTAPLSHAAGAVAFGMAPALQSNRMDPWCVLKEGRLPAGAMHRTKLSALLVVAQTAFSVVLLVAAGLLLRLIGQLGTLPTVVHYALLLVLYGLVLSLAGPTVFRRLLMR